jgi:Neuraminidase (sialidase)
MMMDSFETVAYIEHKEDNPRNSEGSFVTLKDGRILFAYSRFSGECGDDEGKAVIAGMVSSDEGRSWEDLPEPLVDREGDMNVMSASLLRLHDGRIALFYLRKNSLVDSQLYMRVSEDEGQSWVNPVLCTAAVGYHVVNNDRVIQLKDGTLIVPATFHRTYIQPDGSIGQGGSAIDGRGLNTFFRSDDAGKTWYNAGAWWATPTGLSQETGIVEHLDGSLTSWCRTNLGCQWKAVSTDNAATWSEPEASEFLSPISPMSIKRHPDNYALIAVWNDHDPRWDGDIPERITGGGSQRSPHAIAVSYDDGQTWQASRLLETDTSRAYCYTAIHFTSDAVLLSYGCGRIGPILEDSKIIRIPNSWLFDND